MWDSNDVLLGPRPFLPNLRRVRVLFVRLVPRYYGAVRLLPGVHVRRAALAFTDRSRSFDRDTQEISRFSCMLFLSVRGVLDYAGPVSHSRLARPTVLPSANRITSASWNNDFSKLKTRPADTSVYTSAHTSRCNRKTRGQDGFATSFPVGLFHPLQHAGLSRRFP